MKTTTSKKVEKCHQFFKISWTQTHAVGSIFSPCVKCGWTKEYLFLVTLPPKSQRSEGQRPIGRDRKNIRLLAMSSVILLRGYKMGPKA
jgi:hypothetical protein